MRRVMMVLMVGLLSVSFVGVALADTPEKDRVSTKPTISVVTTQRAVAPGGLIKVDVFVSNVSDLAVYQVKLAVTGGEGDLSAEALKVDKEHKNYVFGEADVLAAADQGGSRMGAMQLLGSVDVTRPAYLGTYSYRASADATGTFKVGVELGPNSFLRNGSGRAISFVPGKSAKISIAGETPGRIGTDKR